jgi:hypothetical protein
MTGSISTHPGCADGYDLTDWLDDRRHVDLSELAAAVGAPVASKGA